MCHQWLPRLRFCQLTDIVCVTLFLYCIVLYCIIIIWNERALNYLGTRILVVSLNDTHEDVQWTVSVTRKTADADFYKLGHCRPIMNFTSACVDDNNRTSVLVCWQWPMCNSHCADCLHTTPTALATSLSSNNNLEQVIYTHAWCSGQLSLPSLRRR